MTPVPARTPPAVSIAYFVSPHGFGHASRACAVMDALKDVLPGLRCEIFTTVPEWFFAQSLTGDFGYHELLTDVGMVQKTPLQEDVDQTVARLEAFFPFDQHHIDALADDVTALGCRAAVCDIAPMGVAAARAAGIPSVLIENFTWDWIYAPYAGDNQALNARIAYLRDLFASADHHIQTEPACRPTTADLNIGPVSRRVRTPASQVRRALGIPEDGKTVVVTMGGVDCDYARMDWRDIPQDVHVVLAGRDPSDGVRGNVVCLPKHSPVYHPDLINAGDAVIGKAGYSTLAEIYQAGVPFGYVSRPSFREAGVLEAYIDAEIPSLAIDGADFSNGLRRDVIRRLLGLGRVRRNGHDNARLAAEYIARIMTQDASPQHASDAATK